MFFLDLPYVSDFLKDTLKDSHMPIVKTKIIDELDIPEDSNFISEKKAIEMAKTISFLPVYCTSENSIGWISKNLPFSSLPEKINLFKDKLRFRKLIEPLFPDFYFKSIKYENISDIKYENLPKKFVIKPAIGFMSMGVHIITSLEELKVAKHSIKNEFNEIKGLYPLEVMDTKDFIIEEIIYGDEYAVDVYFDSHGKSVILNILKHMFFSDSDVGDRVYSTSKDIIKANIQEFQEFLNKIGKLAKIQNFPAHIELRRRDDGILIPIEVNPMRFGGWCTTADMAYMAYGFNPYLYYFNEQKPNWDEIFAKMGDELYSIVVLDNSTKIPTSKINFFDYEKLLLKFKSPIKLRKINFHKYPVFGFLFTKTKKRDMKELEDILASDLLEFVS